MDESYQIAEHKAKVEALEEKHQELSREVGNLKERLDKGFDSLSQKLDKHIKDSKPNTAVIVSTVGVGLTAVVWFIRLMISPLGDKIDESIEKGSNMRAELMRVEAESTKDHERSKSWNEWLVEDVRELREENKKQAEEISKMKGQLDK